MTNGNFHATKGLGNPLNKPYITSTRCKQHCNCLISLHFWKTIMKKLALVSLLGLVTFAGGAHAATANANFMVDVSLTTVCRVVGSAVPSLAFSYTAFSSANVSQTTPVAISFECTRNLALPTVAFDGATPIGVVSGLQYTLTATAGTVGAGTAADNTQIGTPATYAYSITGVMPSGQAGTANGTNASIVTGQAARTLIITY